MKRNLLILLTGLLLSCSVVGCGSETVISINVENDEKLYDTTFGKDAFKEIGNGLWYDSTTRIVYFKIEEGTYDSFMSAYYAPNGLPYKYNPETNTFEEIEVK